MGLPIIGLAISLAGSLIQGQMQATQAKYQAEVQNQQLAIDAENARLKGEQDQNDRQEAYLRAEATNRVAVAVSTAGGRSYSYEQGIGPYNKSVVAKDLATSQFNTAQETDRMAYQIKVNKWNANVEANNAVVGSFFQGLSSIGTYISRPGGLLA